MRKNTLALAALSAFGMSASLWGFELTLTPLDAQAETQNGVSYTIDPFSYDLNVSRFTGLQLQRRGIMEFSLAAIPAGATITSAELNYSIGQFTSDGTNYGQIEFHGYAGNGVLSAADAIVPFNLLGTSSAISSLTPYSTSLSTAYLQSLLGGPTSHLGVMTYQKNINYQSSFYSTDWDEEFPGEGPSLRINYTLPPPPPSDIFVAQSFFSTNVLGYTFAGALTNTIAVPVLGEDYGAGRGMVVDERNHLHVMNGDYDAHVSTYDLSTAGWTHKTYPGFTAGGNITHGGVAAFGDFVFANDMGDTKGIIRFNYADGTSQRFIEGDLFGEQIQNVIRGHDGLLYALSGISSDGTRIRAFNPISMALVKDFEVGGPTDFINARAIAVNAEGEVYAASWDGNVYHLDDEGNVIDSLDIGGSLSDIDLAADGRIVVGSWSKDVYLTDESLASYTSFEINDEYALFVTFADPIVTMPGDADFDGDVDLSDLSSLASNYGQNANMGWHAGDFDGDHDVDLSDLSTLAANYGSGEAQAFSDFQQLAAVPEPSFLAAFAIAGAMICVRCRKLR